MKLGIGMTIQITLSWANNFENNLHLLGKQVLPKWNKY
jgi:hypothetical protein